MAREKTNAILELVSEGEMDAETALHSVLFWMSEAEVARMVNNDVDFDGYGLSDDEDEDEDIHNSMVGFAVDKRVNTLLNTLAANPHICHVPKY